MNLKRIVLLGWVALLVGACATEPASTEDSLVACSRERMPRDGERCDPMAYPEGSVVCREHCELFCMPSCYCRAETGRWFCGDSCYDLHDSECGPAPVCRTATLCDYRSPDAGP